MNIPAEAVEAAHRAICKDTYEECQEWRGKCVKAVEAAAPHILAQGWDEGFDYGNGREPYAISDNPYRPTP